MKTKNPFILLLAILAFANLNAQDSESDDDNGSDVDCKRELSIFYQDSKAKDYDSAKPHYDNLVENCPKEHLAIYQFGHRMLTSFIDKAKQAGDDDKVKEYSEALIDNYKLRLENFPTKTNKGDTYAKVAQLKYDNGIGTKEEQYKAFDKAWNTDPESFNDPKSLYTYFSLMVDLQDEGKRGLQDVFENYDRVMAKVNKEQAQRAEEEQELTKKRDSLGEKLSSKEKKTLHDSEIFLRNYVKIKGSIDDKIGSRADCENLVPLYKKNFDDHKDDADWLKLAAYRLSIKKCTSGEEGDLFVNITEALHEIDPSAKSAKYLGQLAAHQGNNQKALKYYQESVDLEEDPLDKAKVYYQLGNMYSKKGQKSQARTFYRKALSNNRSLGQAHLKIASLYAKSVNECGESTFDKQAVYWLAAQEADQAARVDPSLKSTAEQTAASYRGRAPSKSDVFKQGKKGETIKIKCWIHSQIAVPSF